MEETRNRLLYAMPAQNGGESYVLEEILYGG